MKKQNMNLASEVLRYEQRHTRFWFTVFFGNACRIGYKLYCERRYRAWVEKPCILRLIRKG